MSKLALLGEARAIGWDAIQQIMDAEVRTNARIKNCDYLGLRIK